MGDILSIDRADFAKNPYHELIQYLLAYKNMLNTDLRVASEMRSVLVQKIRDLGGLEKINAELVKLIRQNLDVGTVDELGIDDWSWLPEDLR